MTSPNSTDFEVPAFAGVQFVSCWSRAKIQALKPPANALLVSIYDPIDGPLLSYDGWKDVQKMCFHDTDGQHLGLTSISKVDGQALASFLVKNSDAEHIYVHCHAGQSRSAGAALAIAEALQVPAFRGKSLLSFKDPFYNRKVYATVLNSLLEVLSERS